MTTRTQQRSTPRWVLVFPAALIAALAAILSGTTASASAAGVAENRVGALNVAGEVLVGPPEHITAGQRLGNHVAGPDFVVATGVATNTVDIAGARFAQNGFSEAFSTGKNTPKLFKGRTIDDVVGDLRSGDMTPKDVPIDVIVR
jgi:hypothetical protein